MTCDLDIMALKNGFPESGQNSSSSSSSSAILVILVPKAGWTFVFSTSETDWDCIGCLVGFSLGHILKGWWRGSKPISSYYKRMHKSINVVCIIWTKNSSSGHISKGWWKTTFHVITKGFLRQPRYLKDIHLVTSIARKADVVPVSLQHAKQIETIPAS